MLMPGVERLANPSQVRLAKLVASLSLATDLGLGQPMEHILRSCTLGLRIAEDVGLDGSLFVMRHGLLPELEETPEDQANA
jgi:hypothetical protein